jgi:hypothetical protein
MIVPSDGANIEIAEEVGNFYTLFKQFANNFVYKNLRLEKATSVSYNLR